MYAVIFRAQIRKTDDEFLSAASKLRLLATEKYGCLDFISVTEGNQELTVSYWDNEQQIKAWNQDPEHRRAKEQGRNHWYSSYQVQIVEVKREY
jgi:heme-degrading monooxygenase HmoA